MRSILGKRRGDNLRKLVVSAIGLLLVASIVFPLAFPLPVSAQTGWRPDYTYRKELWVTGSPDGAQTDYQIPVTIYCSSAGTDSADTVYLNSHNATSPCIDIRFTTDDGVTLLSYWNEIPNTDPMVVWVKWDWIPAHPRSQMFYMYYGNAGAADASSLTNTFIAGDDFETGVDGAALGVPWTVLGGTVEYDDDDTIVPYGGLLCGKWVGGAPPDVEADMGVTHSESISIRFRLYKEDAAQTITIHGGTDARAYWRCDDLGGDDIEYFDVGYVDTGDNMAPDQWVLFETRDFDWTSYTYDIAYAAAGSIATVSAARNDLGMHVIVFAPTLDRLYISDLNANVAGEDFWIDDVIIRNFTENEPWVEAWGNEHRNAGIETHYVSGRGENWAIMNAEIAGVHTGQTVSQRGFDYGITEAMVESWVEAGAWTASTDYSRVQTGLGTAGSSYYFRAKTYDGTAWSYGRQKRFALSPQQYEWYDNNDDAYSGTAIHSSNWTFQTFTVNDIAFEATSIDLKLLRVGDVLGDITVSLRTAGNGEPSRDDLAVAVLDATIVSTTTPTFYTFDLDIGAPLEYDETYAIVVRALEGDSTKYIRWRWDSTGGYPDGNAGYSTDYAATWNQYLFDDHMFRVWGEPVLEVEAGAVFEQYVEADDWLFLCRYLDIYPPYYDGEDVSALFYLQLIEEDGLDLLAQVAVPAWGYKPGSIYLNPDMSAPLEWEKQYRLRVYGDFDGYPIAEYPLFPTTWWGDDLTRLDAWVASSAVLISDYYGVSLTTYIAEKGLVLNSEGGVIFITGIPALNLVRPDLFEIYAADLLFEEGEFTQAYQLDLVWQTMLGPDLTAAFTEMGSIFSLDGAAVGAILAFIFYAAIAITCFPPGHAIAAIVIAFPFMVAAWYLGLIALVVMGVVLAVAAILFVRETWWKGA